MADLEAPLKELATSFGRQRQMEAIRRRRGEGGGGVLLASGVWAVFFVPGWAPVFCFVFFLSRAINRGSQFSSMFLGNKAR